MDIRGRSNMLITSGSYRVKEQNCYVITPDDEL